MAVVCFFKIFFFLFSGFCSHLFQVSGIWGGNRILSTLSKRDSEALFCCSVSTIYSILLLIFHYLEFYLLLPLLCHLSSGPAPSCSAPLPCTAEQLLFPSRLHFSELQNGLCRCLLHEFSACQMLWDMKLKIHTSVCICMWLFFVIMSGKEKVTRNICCGGCIIILNKSYLGSFFLWPRLKAFRFSGDEDWASIFSLFSYPASNMTSLFTSSWLRHFVLVSALGFDQPMF